MMQPQPAAEALTIDAAPRRAWLSPALAGRLPAVAVFVCCTATLVVASLLRADPSGMGTHRQLGLPPCGFEATLGLPCATCGYTTAFTHAAAGRLGLALRTQPAGAVFALLTAAMALISGWASITGASLAPIGRWLWRPRNLVLGGALVLGAWVYKLLIVLA